MSSYLTPLNSNRIERLCKTPLVDAMHNTTPFEGVELLQAWFTAS
ncbi:hypothetical protein [Shewanella sp. VB17]|nr:hypothetical protein [Shewanella sp. VB17]